MAIVYTAKAAVEIEGFQAYPDASGAPALVRVADFSYAADFIGGEVRLACIKHPGNGRRASEVAAERARRTYEAFVTENTTAEWRAANVVLYSEAS